MTGTRFALYFERDDVGSVHWVEDGLVLVVPCEYESPDEVALATLLRHG
jgi:hypothetical protein